MFAVNRHSRCRRRQRRHCRHRRYSTRCPQAVAQLLCVNRQVLGKACTELQSSLARTIDILRRTSCSLSAYNINFMFIIAVLVHIYIEVVEPALNVRPRS